MSESLEHYGVLGMKWGIRRYQPYPVGKSGKFVGNIGREKKRGVKGYSWSDVNAKKLFGTFHGQTRDKDIIIKKGQTLYRVQSSKDIASDRKAIYTTLDGKTHLAYIDIALGGGPGVSEDSWRNGTYSIKMKAEKDLVAPSMNKTMDVFIRTMNEKIHAKGTDYIEKTNIFGKRVVKEHPYDEIRTRGQEFIGDRWIKATTKSDMASIYRLYFDDLMKNQKHRDAFIKRLQKEGYNAIIDEEDFDYGEPSKKNYGGSATIVLNAKDIKISDIKRVKKPNDDYNTTNKLFRYLNRYAQGMSAIGYGTPEQKAQAEKEMKNAWESKKGQEWLKYLEIEKKK